MTKKEAKERALHILREIEKSKEDEWDEDDNGWKAKRYDFLIGLWQRHAPMELTWPNDMPFELFFSTAIPLFFRRLDEAIVRRERHEATADHTGYPRRVGGGRSATP